MYSLGSHVHSQHGSLGELSFHSKKSIGLHFCLLRRSADQSKDGTDVRLVLRAYFGRVLIVEQVVVEV